VCKAMFQRDRIPKYNVKKKIQFPASRIANVWHITSYSFISFCMYVECDIPSERVQLNKMFNSYPSFVLVLMTSLSKLTLEILM
jgi:hypothetical protein